MNNFVFIINGSGTSGKDTVVEFFEKNFSKAFHVYNVSSIDKVREAAKLLGWAGSKSSVDREFLHQLKTLASNFYDHSTNYMFSKFSTFESPYVSFFHIREPNEIDYFKSTLANTNANVFTILVTRKEAPQFDNNADKNVCNYEYDYVIENDGTLYDLEVKVLKLFEGILKCSK